MENELSKEIKMPRVYEYLSYQAFLRDHLRAKKQKSPQYSLSAFCQRSKVLSKTYLSMVLNGSRNLPAKKSALLGEALGMNASERRYFEGLVHFNHAKSNREKEIYLKQLVAARPLKHRANLSELGYGVLYSWHCLVILELVKLRHAQVSAKWISERLKKRLTVIEAQRAIDTLVELQLVTRDQAGKLTPAHSTIRTTDELRSLAIQKYHSTCLELGANMLRTSAIENREFASINLLLSQKKFDLVKEKIKRNERKNFKR